MHCTGWWEKLSGVIYQNHLAHGICSVAAKQQGLCCCHRMKPSLPATAYVISLAAVLLLQYTKHSPTPGPLHSLFFLPTTLPPPNPFISGKLLLIFQVSAKTTLHHRTSSQALSTPISHSCSIPFVSFKSHLYSFILCLMHVYFIRLEVVKEQGPSSLFIRHVAGLVHCDQWRLINSL